VVHGDALLARVYDALVQSEEVPRALSPCAHSNEYLDLNSAVWRIRLDRTNTMVPDFTIFVRLYLLAI